MGAQLHIPGLKVIKRLGEGGMATVYLVEDESDGARYALKLLVLPDDKEFLLRFKREIKILSILEHPNIVKVHRYEITEKPYYYLMEYIDAGDLEGFIDKHYEEGEGIVEPREVIPIVDGMLSAIQHAHEKGIVHRDLKPSNILLTSDLTPYLTDFGIARKSDSTRLTATGNVVGTPLFMAPEQMRGKPATPRSDIYSAALIIYDMLTGEVPHDAEEYMAIATERLKGEVPPPSSHNPTLSPSIDKVLLKALALDPRERYSSASAFRRDLLKALRGERVDVKTPTRTRRKRASLATTASEGKRDISWSAVLLLAVLLSAAGAGWIVHFSWSDAAGDGRRIRIKVVDRSAPDATIRLETSFPSSVVVRYGDTAELGERTSPEKGFSTNHEITIDGLTPGSRIYWKAKIVDEEGRETETPLNTFDVTAPSGAEPGENPRGTATQEEPAEEGILRGLKVKSRGSRRTVTFRTVVPVRSWLLLEDENGGITQYEVSRMPSTFHKKTFEIDPDETYMFTILLRSDTGERMRTRKQRLP